jgi:hypothetical protein
MLTKYDKFLFYKLKMNVKFFYLTFRFLIWRIKKLPICENSVLIDYKKIF